MEDFSYKACSCSMPACPEIEIFENIDGEKRVIITDDFSGCINISLKEMELISRKFMQYIRNNKLKSYYHIG